MISPVDAADCPVCGAARAGGPKGVECDRCGFRARRDRDGILSAGDAPAAISYPEEGRDLTRRVEDESFWFRHRNRVLLAVLRRLPCGRTLWDVGGGNGFPARFLEDAGQPVVVVEPGRAGCLHAVARGLRSVIRATLEDLRLPPGRLAGIGLFDVLEHLESPAGLLSESFRVLRPGGRIYVTTPAYGFLWSDEDEYAGHRRRYSARELRGDLEGAGLRVETLFHFFGALLVPVLLRRALPYRLGRRRARMAEGDHLPPEWARGVLETLLRRELGRIERGGSPPFGTSLLAVATRP